MISGSTKPGPDRASARGGSWIGPQTRKEGSSNERADGAGQEDYGYPDIAGILGKSEDNVRQLATRARNHVEQRRPRFQTTREQRDELARRFFAAVEQGDLAGLEALLAADVKLTGDGGGKAPAPARALRGRNRVARMLIDGIRLGTRLPGVCCALSRSTAALERSFSTHSSG
jgi:SnoaL-like domain